MSMYDQLLQLYAKVPSRSLSQDLDFYMRTGYVICRPDLILIGRRIEDGWFIHAAVAESLGAVLAAAPYYLPYVGWAREARGRSQIKWYSWEQLTRIISYEDDRNRGGKHMAEQFDLFPAGIAV